MNKAVPRDIDFSQIVSERFNTLTKSEKRIANYIRKNPEECAFLSAAEMAERLSLSEATMVRFARTMGFSSYPTMRASLQAAFRNRVTHSTRLRSRLDDLREAGDIFDRLVVSEIDYLTQALETVDRAALHQAEGLLRSHARVFVFGLGPSTSLVDLMQLRLVRFGRQVIPLTTSGREFLEPLLLMNDQDLLVVFCFFDVTPALQLVLDYANEAHCKVIMITDTLGPIVGSKADVVLSAKRGPLSGFHSMVVPMTIVNAILLTMAQDDSEKSLATLDELDELRDRYQEMSKKTY
jgi:DNA-binding MurR/RpiR family transcriptional regulator